MKLHNIMSIVDGLRAAAQRFPASFASAFLVASTGLMLVHEVGDTDSLARLLIVSIFGFLLFGSIDLFCERGAVNTKIRSIISAIGLGLLAGYYAYLPTEMNSIETSVVLRSIAWGVGLVFLALFAPYIKKENGDASGKIWYFDTLLVAAIVLTGIWVALAQGGISIAISAIDYLFNVGVTDKTYQIFVAILFGFFGPVFLLSRVPKDTEQTIEAEEYPKELRLILQYVFIPLVALYFVILYAYVIKIVVSGEWPVGTLAYMILGFSALGMVVYACLYPLRSSVAWMRKMGDMYHMVLIPQIGMLFWALWFRITQYGITENRYYVLVAGLWLLGLSVYFLISKKKDLRVIPVSIFFVALLSTFGPWGALAVSERSQQGRMEALLSKNKIMVDGQVHAVSAAEVPFEDKKELGAITSYLIDTHGKDSFAKFFDEDAISAKGREEQKKQIMEKFGLTYQESRAFGREHFFYNTPAMANAIAIARFDHAITNQGMFFEQTIEGVNYQFKINRENDTFEIGANGMVVAQASLDPLLTKLETMDAGRIPKDVMVLAFENDRIAFEYHIERIGGELKEEGHAIDDIDGLLLFTIK